MRPTHLILTALVMLSACSSAASDVDELATAADGSEGADGASGADGKAGASGADGSNGADGSDGSAGDDGSDGSDGAQGPQGPQGPQGTPGAAGYSGPGWADAGGVRVIDGQEPIHVDALGYEWNVVVSTGALMSRFETIPGSAYVYYDDYGCQGDAWIVSVQEISTPGIYDGWTYVPLVPRQPFQVRYESDWFSLADDAMPVYTWFRSEATLGSCADLLNGMGGYEWGSQSFRLDDLIGGIQRPATTWTAPLHRVR